MSVPSSSTPVPPPLFATSGAAGASRGPATVGRPPASGQQMMPAHYRSWQGSMSAPPPLFTAAPPPAKDRFSTSLQEALQRPEVIGILLGVGTCFCMTLLPVFGGISLLMDPNYRFWKGSSFPFLSIGMSVAILLVAMVTGFLLYRRARVQDLNEATMVVAASVFSALLGVTLLVVSLEASQGLNHTARELMQGCSSHGHAVHVLNDYSQVLANIRATPACAAEASVESCEGFSENKYTEYIKYLEQEFECGPVCTSAAAASFQHERWGGSAALVQTAAVDTPAEDAYVVRRAGGGRTLRSKKEGAVPALMPEGPDLPDAVAHGQVTTSQLYDPLAQATTTTKAPAYWESFKGPAGREPPGAASGYTRKLFSHGYTRASCLPLVATRLEVLAFASNEIPFYEGCGLVVISLIISMVACVGRGCYPQK